MLKSSLAGRLLPLLLLSLAACSDQKTRPAAKPALPVTVAVARRQPIPVELQAVGQVEAAATVTVRSQVAGMIAAVHFREGDEVKKGALLFTLDPTPLQAALAKARADLEQKRVEAANARRDAERFAQLLAAGFVSSNEADAAQAKAAGLAAALAAAQAAVDDAAIRLAYGTIRAPQSGRTGALLVHPGTLVKANDAPDLVTINTLEPVTVGFSIPEGELGRLRRHLAAGALAATAQPPGEPGPAEQGTITFFDNTVDGATGTIRLKATFANRQRRLWPGQYVAVRVVLETLDQALVVPTAALQSGQQGSYLFVVGADAKVSSRPVVPGLAWNQLTVIEEGLEPGETVVTDGQLRLFPGAKVALKTAASTPPKAAQP